ncbi:MAG: hypothetical protein HC772_10660 [Leptolyngbyaceae cyanobacterium CRU_2_3]|nr:hypothetical protein [Leptolyngbyaceae cyanobacterium CRU_2_3]
MKSLKSAIAVWVGSLVVNISLAVGQNRDRGAVIEQLTPRAMIESLQIAVSLCLKV